jgi:hypothetical protein
VLVLAAGCRREARDPWLTYYNGEFGLSLRHPASWRSELARQGDVSYRFFAAPNVGAERKPALSMTLVAERLAGDLDAQSQRYLAGQKLVSRRDETRPGAAGTLWIFDSPDGVYHHRLLLFAADGHVYGLHAQGEARYFKPYEGTAEEIEKSFTLERPAHYEEVTDRAQRFSFRVPPSWTPTRTLSGGGSYLRQFNSPAFTADARGQTAHASLTLSVETLPAGATADSFYASASGRLGEAVQVMDHKLWKDGSADVLRSETPISVSRGKRFYRVAEGRGYTLSFEMRDDVYPRMSRWCDIIASTLKVGAELDAR